MKAVAGILPAATNPRNRLDGVILMNLRRVATTMALTSALAVGGALLAVTPAQAGVHARTTVDSPVQAFGHWESRGVYPTSECESHARFFWSYGIPARCEWHLPLSMANRELWVWV
jgi:hypothetical protein